MNTELQLFVRESLAKGQSRDAVRKVLLSSGWQEDEVSNALSAYADTAFPVPVPKRKPYLSAREAFMYLVLFLTLYISAISFGTIIFQSVNHWMPDPVEYRYDYYYDGIREKIRMSTAALIIAYPIFLWVSSILGKSIKRDPEKRGSKVRKWLTYITLFIAAGVIIGDLISLVYNLLAGELTMRFILKTVTVAVISGAIFGFYLLDLRSDEKES